MTTAQVFAHVRLPLLAEVYNLHLYLDIKYKDAALLIRFWSDLNNLLLNSSSSFWPTGYSHGNKFMQRDEEAI